jgi:hypothetical protein
MDSRFTTWSLFYENLDRNLKVNQKMNQIMNLSHFQLSEEDWITNLKNNPGLAMLLVNGFLKLMLLHDICYLQENFSVLNQKFWDFQVMVIMLKYIKLILIQLQDLWN